MSKIDFSARIPAFSDSETNKRKKEENKKDIEYRSLIQKKIRELKKLGYTEKDALIKINLEYSNSRYRGFFKGWVENAYKEKKNRGLEDEIKMDLDERM